MIPTAAAELRFLVARAVGLLRRGVASLRTRGLHGSWRRLRAHLRPPRADGLEDTLYAPDGSAPPASVPASGAPVASIVIPVYGQLGHTLACLQALASHPPAAACEVIVVDDASPDDSAATLARIQGLRLHRRPTNGGFIAACNEGAALARGDVIVFLNNDTVPQPGWLDALLATFDAHPGTGLVGAQLLYPDGRLQESGGVVFADGSAWNYGRFESAADPRYAFVRDADYCSGAAIAVPRALFADVGGFDARYAPAYYEDTDLAFKLRAAGWRVLVQPAARVVHVEGGTGGTDLAQGPKAGQVRNQAVFASTWAEVLQRHPARRAPDAGSVAAARPQVLVIDALVPAPDRDSGSLRLANVMRLLIEEGAHVVFLPANRRHAGDAALARAADRTRALELEVIARADATLVVSEVERDLLARDAPGARVEVLSNVHRVAGPGAPFGDRDGLVFVGGFRHPPNVDAVCWFVHDVFPRLRATLPGIAFHCIGDEAPAEVRALAAVPGVHLHGHLPDIAPYMSGCRVALAPLRYGAGVKGKVNLSMAHGQPVVATRCAVEGMHLREGEDVLVADTPEAFADAVARLYTDQGLWSTMAARGLENVARHFSFDAARGTVRRVLLHRGEPARP